MKKKLDALSRRDGARRINIARHWNSNIHL
jgi:hypothetical protein